METAKKLVQFKFEADSELGLIITQIETMLSLMKQNTTAANQHTAAIQANARVIVQSLGTINSAQQQTTQAVNQTTAAVGQNTAAVNQNTQTTLQSSTQQIAAIKGVSQSLGSLEDNFDKIKNLIAGAFALHEIREFGLQVIDAKSKIDIFKVGLTQMLQSERDVADLYPKLIELAKTTPFQINDLMETTIRLKAMGVATNELIPTLNVLGNAAAVIGTEKLPLVAKAYTDVMNKGILMKQEINQFAENGIPIYDLMAQSMGKTRAEVVKLAEAHQLTFEHVKEALKDASDVGGRYYGLMQVQAKTLAGQVSNLKDTYFLAKATVGDFFEDTITEGIKTTSKLIDATIGSENAVDRTINVIKSAASAWVTYQLATNAAEIQTRLLAAAIVVKETAIKAAQIVMGTYNLTMITMTGTTQGFTAAQLESAVVARSFWATLAANPIGLVIAAVGTLVTAYYAYKAASIEVNEITDQATLGLIKEKVELTAAVQAVQGYSIGTRERTAAVEVLMQKYPGLLGYIDADKISNVELNKALAEQIALLDSKIKYAAAAAAADAIYNQQVEINRQQLEIIIKLRGAYKELSDAYPDNNKFMLALQELQKEQYNSAESLRNMSTAAMATTGSYVAFSGETAKYTDLQRQSNALSQQMALATTEVSKASSASTNSQVADIQRQLTELTAAHNAKKVNDDDYKAKRQELLNEIKRLNGEEVSSQTAKNIALAAGDNGRKETKWLTEKEIAVLTKQVQEDSLKEQLKLIDLHRDVEIERINSRKTAIVSSEQEAADRVKAITEQAEADKKALIDKYNEARKATLLENLALSESIVQEEIIDSASLREAQIFDAKESAKFKKQAKEEERVDAKATKEWTENLQKEIEAAHNRERELIEYNAKVEKKAREDGIKMAIDYLSAQDGLVGELGKVFKRAFDDIDLLNGKTIQSYEDAVVSAQAHFSEVSKLYAVGTQQYDEAQDKLVKSKKDLTDAKIATGEATVGMIMMVAQAMEAIKAAYIDTLVESNKAIMESFERTKDIMNDFYDNMLRVSESSLEAELMTYEDNYDKRLEILEKYQKKQMEIAEAKDAMSAQIDFHVRTLEINTDTTEKIGKAWDWTKGPLGPQTLLKIFTAWKEHNAELKAAAYEREAREAEMRIARIEQEQQAAKRILEDKLDALEAERNRFIEVKEAEIDKAEENKDAQIDLLDELLDKIKDKQSQGEDAIRATYDLKKQLLEQEKADEIETIQILDRERNEALDRYRTREINQLTATRDRILATLTDESEKEQVTNAYAKKIADVHKEVEEAKLDKSKGVALATKQLNQEVKDGAVQLKEEEKSKITSLEQQYYQQLLKSATDSGIDLASILAAGEAREISALQAAKQRDLEKATSAQQRADITDRYDRLIAEKHQQYESAKTSSSQTANLVQRELESRTADIVKGLKDQIASKESQTTLQMKQAQQDYANYVISANRQIFEAEKQMAIAKIRAEIAVLRGKRNIFNRGRVDSAIADMENAIGELSGLSGGGVVGVGQAADNETENVRNATIQDHRNNGRVFDANTLEQVTEAYTSDGKRIVLEYTDEDRTFNAYKQNGDSITIRHGRGKLYDENGNLIQEFYKGTDWLEGHGYPTGRDTVPIRANIGERIIPTELNEKLGGRNLKNEDLVDGYLAFDAIKKLGGINLSELSKFNFGISNEILSASSARPNYDGIEKHVKRLADIIEAKPEVGINIDASGMSIKEVSRERHHVTYYQNIYNRRASRIMP